MIPALIVLHLLATVIWVGGMFFAYMALRPVAATLLEPPLRLPLWAQTFQRFFVWVWAAVIVLPLTGYSMLFGRFGGFNGAPMYVEAMQGLGVLMIAIYVYVFFVPYARLRKHVAAKEFPAAGQALATIRKLVAINLVLGLVTVAVASGGRFFL